MQSTVHAAAGKNFLEKEWSKWHSSFTTFARMPSKGSLAALQRDGIFGNGGRRQEKDERHVADVDHRVSPDV
jgi:hypothetical protein